MHDLNDLYYFVQVVEHQGFAPAGRALSMPKSKLSRRIAQLEERLGVRLIQRSTRRFAVTEIGQDYYRHCLAMLVEANAAQEAIDRVSAQPQGSVRISCPTALHALTRRERHGADVVQKAPGIDHPPPPCRQSTTDGKTLTLFGGPHRNALCGHDGCLMR